MREKTSDIQVSDAFDANTSQVPPEHWNWEEKMKIFIGTEEIDDSIYFVVIWSQFAMNQNKDFKKIFKSYCCSAVFIDAINIHTSNISDEFIVAGFSCDLTTNTWKKKISFQRDFDINSNRLTEWFNLLTDSRNVPYSQMNTWYASSIQSLEMRAQNFTSKKFQKVHNSNYLRCEIWTTNFLTSFNTNRTLTNKI